ncbi:RluA family pseudouridine synthase [Polymorphobacter sp.]|uniref:RluA family pseudouridine synthase n=1 Tax=Polymorphobacter sp. TaxID=1909290 RepID=UPI003F702930
MPVPILYQDQRLLVIDKPAGLAVHPGPRTPHSLEALLPAIADRAGIRRLPTIMHRLDRDTSGCLVLAITPASVRRVAGLFEQRLVHKLYWARLDALPEEDSGTIDAPLAKVSSAEAGWRMVVDPAGKRAVTRWRILDRPARLIEFRPETGRTHQLRVHANCLGTSIENDPVYGPIRGSAGRPLMRLHARMLEIPMSDRDPLTVTAPLPAEWQEDHAQFVQLDAQTAQST